MTTRKYIIKPRAQLKIRSFYKNVRQQRQVTDERIAIGALIRTILSETDGLTFKNGRTEKPKRLSEKYYFCKKRYMVWQ